MNNGTWIVEGTRALKYGHCRSTIAKPNTAAEAIQAAADAMKEGYFDVEMYFHEYDDEETGPAYGSFSEALEYDFSQN